MSKVEHSKCKKCGKILHVSELKKDTPSGDDMVCVDTNACKKSNQESSPDEVPIGHK